MPSPEEAEASDPLTGVERLKELARLHPELRGAIYLNSNSPHGLRVWLEGLDDPSVLTIKRSRGREVPAVEPPKADRPSEAADPAPWSSSPTSAPSAGREKKSSGHGPLKFFTIFISVGLVIWFIASGGFSSLSGSSSKAIETSAETGAGPTPSETTTAYASPASEGATTGAILVDAPSRNISCELRDGVLGCSIAQRNYSESGQEDCGGALFSIAIRDDSVGLDCDVEYLGHEGDEVHHLQYGETAVMDRYACTIEETGMTCWDQITGHGFVISRAEHVEF